MSKPRILVIENSIAVTGALKSILRSSAGLSGNYDFYFLLPGESSAINSVRSMGFEAYEFPMRELRRNFFSMIAYVPALIRNAGALSKYISKLQIDLIVVNDFYNLLAPAYKMLGGRVPYICYVRFLPSKFPQALVKTWCGLHYRYAHKTIVVSDAVRRELTYTKNVVVIGNELPTDHVSSSSNNSTTVLYPANYIQGKGHEYALQSWAMISKKHPGWKLRFVGGDMGLNKNKEYKKALAEIATQLNIESSIEWCEFSEEISREYIASSFVLNFSESESFSMTCLEAMYYGRPVIATRSGGPAEIIDHNQSGILVDLKDISAMANAIEYLITHPANREDMAKLAYERVRIKFSFENTVGKLGKAYDESLKI